MKPLDNRFFTRGGFSSSQWNPAEKTHDANMMDSSYQDLNSDDLKKHQSKSRRGHQRFECGLSA